MPTIPTNIDIVHFLRTWYGDRQRSRTDLLWFCNEVLGYKEVCREVHGPILDSVQKFQGGTDYTKPDGSLHHYEPSCSIWALEGSRENLWLDPRGHFKCLPVGEIILTATGEYLPIEQVKVGDKVLGMDDNYSLEWNPVQAIQLNLPQACSLVTLRSGRTIKASNNHPFRTLLGWKDASQLEPGDRLALAGKIIPLLATEEINYGEILGWFLGDGSFSNQTVTNQSAEFRAMIIKSAKSAGGQASESFFAERTPCVRVRKLLPLWRSLGLMGKTAESKFIPKTIFRCKRSVVADVLRTLFAADGTSSRTGISLTTKSEQLAKDVQHLLLRFDIYSRRFICKGFWFVWLASTPMVERFEREIGWIKASTFHKAKVSNPNINTIPSEWRKLLPLNAFSRDNQEKMKLIHSRIDNKYATGKEKVFRIAQLFQEPLLEQLASDDIYWDEVKSVASAGLLPTIDLQVEGGTFAVDDIITHNTTILTVSHSIQWILNYPDIRILVSMATGPQVQTVGGELLKHFRFNEKFRMLFPEYVPPAKNAKDFGSLEGFTVPCRKNKMLRDSTVATASIGKVTAGAHYDVIKNSDLVVLERMTFGAIEETRAHLRSLYPLLERGNTSEREKLGLSPRRGWMDLEGTRYGFTEAYGEIVEREEKVCSEKGIKCWEESSDGLTKKHSGRWFIHIRKNRWPDNDKGKILFPQKFSHQDFNEMKEDDPFLYSANQQNEPVPEGSGLVGQKQLEALFVPRQVLKGIPMHWHMTVDLAGMEPENKGDDIAFNIHGFDRDGRLNFVEILAGRFDEREVIDFLFEYCKAFPQIQDIKIEREAHWRTLKPFLMREQEKRVQSGKWKYLPPIIDIKRDNRTSKKERIFGLRPWIRAGIIRFAAEIKSRHQVTQEVLRFSRTSTYADNCLDTMADAMQNRDGGVTYDVYPGAPREITRSGMGNEHFIGFDPTTHMDRWQGDVEETYPYCDPRTGL